MQSKKKKQQQICPRKYLFLKRTRSTTRYMLILSFCLCVHMLVRERVCVCERACSSVKVPWISEASPFSSTLGFGGGGGEGGGGHGTRDLLTRPEVTTDPHSQPAQRHLAADGCNAITVPRRSPALHRLSITRGCEGALPA